MFHKNAARPSRAAPARPNPVGIRAAAFVVDVPVAVAEAAVAVAELSLEDASDATEPAWLWTALRADAASVVILPRILFALEDNEVRLAAAAVLPVTACEARLERVAEKADLAELKLSAIDSSAPPADSEAEAAAFEAEFVTEASEAATSEETDDNELETAEGASELVGDTVDPPTFPCAITGKAPTRDVSKML